MIATPSTEIHSIQLRGKRFSFDSPVVMGILNVNDASFFSGSRVNEQNIIALAQKHIDDGATFLDVGATSTKPGETISDPDEEWKRLDGALQLLKRAFPEVYISIDTYHGSVAEKAIDAGADMINDISAGSIDPQMIKTVVRLNVPYVLMHMQGTPATMQVSPSYKDVIYEVFGALHQHVDRLRNAGLNDIIVDPGFGFGKTLEHNYQLLQQLEVFHKLKTPLLVGLSRKSMITRLLNVNAEEALNGTTVLNTLSLQKGAHILRVHDVKPAIEAIRILQMLRSVKRK
jgi:dihydropteroate synthase